MLETFKMTLNAVVPEKHRGTMFEEEFLHNICIYIYIYNIPSTIQGYPIQKSSAAAFKENQDTGIYVWKHMIINYLFVGLYHKKS